MLRTTGHIGKLLAGWRARDRRPFAELFQCFRLILELNNRILTAIASMNSKLGGGYVFDLQYLRASSSELTGMVRDLIYAMDDLAPGKYSGLNTAYRSICARIEDELAGRLVVPDVPMVLPFAEIGAADLDAVGGKCANLAEAANILGLAIPEGASATTAAFQAFMRHNGLEEPMAGIKDAWKGGRISVREASDRIRERILAGELPPGLRKALARAVDALPGGGSQGLAVRSSAWGEDGEHSFAGQYVSLLNQPPERLGEAYREVLAGAYSAEAMEYRRGVGYREAEVAMAVSFQAMVDARASGVAYTVSPGSPADNTMLIASAWGLGAPLVSGTAPADRFTVSRERPHAQTSIAVVRKAEALRPAEGGGVESVPVSEDRQTKASLTADQIEMLADTALMLERHFRKPQDIEFAFDAGGGLVILQSRPLKVEVDSTALPEDLCRSLERYPVLMSGRGSVAQQGIAAGPVYLAREGEGLDDFPPGAILVARHSSPSLAPILRRASGVITDVGSPVGHMATIAREFRVPALLNTGNATSVLAHGREVTLDAEQKTVYQGRVAELCLHDLAGERIEETYEYRLLRRLLKRIEPLGLIDPADRGFTPEGCRTLHDITRFVHEKAVETLINLNHSRRFAPSTARGRLHLSVPLDLVVMDIGGGLAPKAKGAPLAGRLGRIEPEQVLSVPMRAFIQGVTEPGVWQSKPVPVDFSSFMSSLTRTFSTELASPKNVGQNLAVLSESYAHLSLRLGYHFTMVDCYVCGNKSDNYAYFRFTGGVTGATRRCRRARFLADVLGANDFSTTLQDDLVVARIKKLDAPEMLRRIRVLGLLVAYTRQLDVSMRDEGQILRHVEEFDKIVAHGA